MKYKDYVLEKVEKRYDTSYKELFECVGGYTADKILFWTTVAAAVIVFGLYTVGWYCIIALGPPLWAQIYLGCFLAAHNVRSAYKMYFITGHIWMKTKK